ncbi:MAG TPA: MerR family transcriptional regulator [Solirubrobacterales bacterium]|nr:MerR family transcriptional regulator [Solirubrobacterales bacterium]
MSAQDSKREAGPRLRIGELSRRTGVNADTLRAWERRYGLLSPERTDGGFRLYGADDEERVRAMRALIAQGVAASEAARLARSGATDAERTPKPESVASLDEPDRRLREALERFNEVEATAVLDEAIAALSIDALVDRVVLPALREVGERWERGEATVGQEHFATAIVRGRLAGLARNWGAGTGPLAILACPPGELHDMGLFAFGLALRARGWRLAYLGPNAPIETIADAARYLNPDAVVLAALTPDSFHASAAEIAGLAERSRVLLAGAGANEDAARAAGAELLSGDPVDAAESLAAGRKAARPG